eukprot:GHVT01029510.1.p1 GENE.GHVT01029510.1~~GHVT01029510.1.p1  ORF type:complete len:291 (-),score=70.21 GHVT01029510.1:96-905(-)
MEEFECMVCRESTYFCPNRLTLVAEGCGHRLCNTCLEFHFGQLGRGVCPVCLRAVSRHSFQSPHSQLNRVEQSAKEIRKRVNAIYNDGREQFEDTPAYNDYLEMKETTIFELATSTDDAHRRELDQKLRQWEKLQAARIAANASVQEAQTRAQLRSVVALEGIFYEQVKLRVGGAATPLVHALQRQHGEVFKGEKQQQLPPPTSEGQPKPLDQAVRKDTDIVRDKPRSNNKDAVEAARIAGGYDKALLLHRARLEFSSSIGLHWTRPLS